VSREIDGGRITLAHQFMQLLDDPLEHAQATLAASRLGFDPAGEFVGVVWLSGSRAPGTAYEAASSLRSELIDLAVRAAGDGRFEIVAQTDSAELLVTQSIERLRGGRLGIGLPRLGLRGASCSIADARMALEAASPKRPVVRFADHWLEALALSESQRIRAVTQLAVDVARMQPHLAETVIAFAESDMSIAATAQSAHLHANSITYRLDRWRSLTGLSPRTFSGLAQSVIVCRMADRLGDLESFVPSL
jgi:DNA-binding PucR family transcriptional regulator